MGLTRTDLYSAEQNELAAILRALAHPARVAIVQHLLRVNACIGGEIVEQIGLAQPTISRHLRELKEVGIVQGTVEGTSINYCIDARRWREVQALLNGLLSQCPDDLECDC